MEQKDKLHELQKKSRAELRNADLELQHVTGKFTGDSQGEMTRVFLSSPTAAETKNLQEAAGKRITKEAQGTTQSAIKRKVAQQSSNASYKNALKKLQNKSDDALRGILRNPKKYNNTEVKVAQDILNGRKMI